MQPFVKAALLCDYALTSEDGKLSAIGMFGNINFSSLPNSYPRFFVVIIVTLDSGTHPIRVGLVDPMGQQMVPDPPSFDVPAEVPGADANLVIGFDNLVFNRPGIHQVQLFLDGRLIHAIPLSVQAMTEEGSVAPRAN